MPIGISIAPYDSGGVTNFTALIAVFFVTMNVGAARSRAKLDVDRVRLQVLLDRAHFSPGEIDGVSGENTRRALRRFQSSHSLRETGNADAATVRALETLTQSPETTVKYVLTETDVRGPFSPVPADPMAQAKLPALGFESALEALGEKFHASPKLLVKLNRSKNFSKPGEEIDAPNIHQDIPPRAASLTVAAAGQSVNALDAQGNVVASYPATTGSEHDPLPVGEWKVTKITTNPVFYYNPDLFWDAPASDTKAAIQPGPNNPVGVVWIGLTKEHYGIHGTPEPSTIGHVESHGCIRLTNWDAAELAKIIERGAPVSLKE